MYKWCLVPECKNNTIKTPAKLFVSVPKKREIRKIWLELAGRDSKEIVDDSSVFFCEDHFDIEKEMANYYKYKMGFSKRVLMIDGVVPSKFHCQEDRKKRICQANTSEHAFLCISVPKLENEKQWLLSSQLESDERIEQQSLEPVNTMMSSGKYCNLNTRSDDGILCQQKNDSPEAKGKEVTNSTLQEIEDMSNIGADIEEPFIQVKIEENHSIQVELQDEHSTQMEVEEKTNNLNSHPRVGSVWVSKSIFTTSDSLEGKELSRVDEMTNTHSENSQKAIPIENTENISVTSTPSILTEQISKNSSAGKAIRSTEKENMDSGKGENEDIFKTCHSENVIPNVHDKLSHVTEGHNSHTQSETNREEIITNDEKQDGQLRSDMHEFVPLPTNNSMNSTFVDDKLENQFISLTINSFEKPKNLADAVKLMKLIDQKIEVLTKLRQDIFISLSETVVSSQETNLGRNKRKLDDSEEANKKEEISVKKKTPVEKNPPENIKPFSRWNTKNEVILFCKVIHEKEECIVGTDTGNIQYHSIYGKKPVMVVTIGQSAISFLEIVRIYDLNYVCTGIHAENELKILLYKRQVIKKKIRLEDTIQAVSNNWGYFFIGGKRGYLTRYDLKKHKVQYEDRICESGIKDLKTTKEGPRKILVICFEDEDGVARVHVRDAMTALHIRTIIDMKNVRCMYLRYSSVYLATDEHIYVYNGTNGDFIRSVLTNKKFFSMKSKGNLLILMAVDGIYAFNMKTNRYLGCFQEEKALSSMFFHEEKIVLTTWENKIVVLEMPDHFKAVI